MLLTVRTNKSQESLTENATQRPSRTAPSSQPNRLESGVIYDIDESQWTSDSDLENDLACEDDDQVHLPQFDSEQVNADLESDFRSAWRHWRKQNINWQKEFPNAQLPEKPDIFQHLIKLNIGPLYTSLQAGTKEFGYLPLMASCSEGQIGALCAESFCERVLSQCNLVLTEGNTLLSDEELEMVVILRMNRDCM